MCRNVNSEGHLVELRLRSRTALVRRRVLGIFVAILLAPPAYFGSYLLLGRHTSGETFEPGYPSLNRYTYHDRGFPFDPWIFCPAARIECWLRGVRTQVLIEDGTYRGGQPIYAYGPHFESED
jgi:hypothetical protein